MGEKLGEIKSKEEKFVEEKKDEKVKKVEKVEKVENVENVEVSKETIIADLEVAKKKIVVKDDNTKVAVAKIDVAINLLRQ